MGRLGLGPESITKSFCRQDDLKRRHGRHLIQFQGSGAPPRRRVLIFHRGRARIQLSSALPRLKTWAVAAVHGQYISETSHKNLSNVMG